MNKSMNVKQPMSQAHKAEISGHVLDPPMQATTFNHLFYIAPPERFRDSPLEHTYQYACFRDSRLGHTYQCACFRDSPLGHTYQCACFRDSPLGHTYQCASTKTEDYPLSEKTDKVVVILQNILCSLENDIEKDRLRVKEEKRKRQKEHRRRREERRKSEMALQRVGTSRHVFSTVNHKPFVIREGNTDSEQFRSTLISRKDKAKIRKHDSFKVSDLKQKKNDSENDRAFSELRSQSLDRKRTDNLDRKRTDSFGVSDWSRHSRDVDDVNCADDAINLYKSSLPEQKENDSNNECPNNEIKNDIHWSKRQLEFHRNCLAKGQMQDKCSTILDNSSDSQGTPTNIRRKLKSFDLLPNYKRNGKDVSKNQELKHISIDSYKSQDLKNSGSVIRPADDPSNVSKRADDTSSEDDDMDIVFPTKSTKSRTTENINRNGEYLLDKESSNENNTKEGHSTEKISAKSEAVTKFPFKIKSPESGTVATIRNEAERPTSAGTSGYSTDEYSCKTTDSEDESLQERGKSASANSSHNKLNKYFLVLQNGINMALKVDHSALQSSDYSDESSRSFLQNISISDLTIPDHVGWLVDQSEQTRVWGAVVDMLFCVFECEGSAKPREVIILPGCSIRPLVYNTAINGLNPNTSSQTITGISKYQFVIDDSSTSRKHVFGTESQNDLDTWFRVLKKASALDPEITNDISSSNGEEDPKCNNRRFSFDGVLPKMGYTPTQDSTRRSQRMRSPREPNDKPETNGCSEKTSITTCTNGVDSLTNGSQPSPRSGLVRNDSRRQSISDFKKLLRQETKPEVSKQLPIKATHFKQQTQEKNTQTLQNGKKLKSFGSFESLLKFKRRKRKQSEDSLSNDDSGSIVSESSTDQEILSRSIDISANVSQLQKGKKLSRSLEHGERTNNANSAIVRRASDIKDRMFNRRPSKPFAKLGDLHDTSMHGFLLHKHHLKWQKLWCVVCRGCFYGFKSNSPEENAHVAVLLSSSGVVFVSKQDKKQKQMYIFKITQEKSRSIYLCSTDYNDLMKWLTVLQMECNSVISNADKIGKSSESENESICSSLSSQSGSVLTISSGEQLQETEMSRSRTKKKKKPPAKPPRKFRNSSCPPSVSRESGTSTGEDTVTSGSISSSNENNTYGSTEELPRYDRAVTHVWQNDRGYLFNAIRAKLTSYRKKDGNMNNKDLIVEQEDTNGCREVRRSRSFNANSSTMSAGEHSGSTTPTDSPTYLRKRHKPLVVKKISATELEERQTIAGYIEKKSVSAQWIRYWYVLHDGTLFCYLTSDDSVTVDVLNLHGYSVTSLVDKFRGKRFVLQLSHDNFTSLYLSMESRDDMENWLEVLEHAIKQPSSAVKEDDSSHGACAGCEGNREDDVGEKRKQVKQKLLEEMLRQKYELERKQAERQKKQRSKRVDSPDHSPSSHYPPDFLSDEQRTSDVTRLRQRRMSTQLKVETIQKQIDKPSSSKRGLFGFGKSKKLDENRNVFLQDQLKELTDKLQKIDTDLNQVENEKIIHESYDVNQNRKTMSTPLSTNSHGLDRNVDSEDEDAKRTGIKNTMQKWTNKTFSKVSVKRKQGIPLNGSMPNLKQTGEINSDDNLENVMNSAVNHEEFNSLESSVTDLTRPLADLKLDLSLPITQNCQSGSPSPSSVGYFRSHSKSSTLSSLSSPRREIDPSVLAEIDAFEELTKQVLGARSKEMPAK